MYPLHATKIAKNEHGWMVDTIEDPQVRVQSNGCFVKMTIGEIIYRFWAGEAEALAEYLSNGAKEARICERKNTLPNAPTELP